MLVAKPAEEVPLVTGDQNTFPLESAVKKEDPILAAVGYSTTVAVPELNFINPEDDDRFSPVPPFVVEIIVAFQVPVVIVPKAVILVCEAVRTVPVRSPVTLPLNDPTVRTLLLGLYTSLDALFDVDNATPAVDVGYKLNTT